MPWKRLYSLIQQRGQTFTIALLVAIVFLVIFELLIKAQSNEARAQSQLEGLTYCNLLRSNLDRELNALL
ncbi:MAG: sensor domain-containing diguanylate cyclase, partial [Methylophilaceae bacterium]|nr:sensor domain-containing diguanylate cyclase [Methylophilaceae bacterium]